MSDDRIDITRSIGALAMVIRDHYPDVSNAVLAMGAAAAVTAAKTQIQNQTRERVADELLVEHRRLLNVHDEVSGEFLAGLLEAVDVIRGGAS